MTKYEYTSLREKSEIKVLAAEWFHSKWGVPTEAYLECMDAYLRNETNMVGIFACPGIKLSAEWALSKMIFITEKTLRRMYVLFLQMKDIAARELLETC